MIYNYELEKQLLAGLIQDPESFIDISDFISHKDFYSENTSLHSTNGTIHLNAFIRKGNERINTYPHQ